MRPLRKLRQGVWYKVRTSVNNRYPLFRFRQALALFAQVLGETAERYVFEIRALRLEEERLVFYIKPEDGFQLPRIMQWFKQTFAVRCNLLNGWSGHIWGDRYWSEILEGEPPKEAERRTGTVMDVEAAEFSPVKGRVGYSLGKPGGRVRPLSGKTKTGVRPSLGKPAEIPRQAAASPG